MHTVSGLAWFHLIFPIVADSRCPSNQGNLKLKHGGVRRIKESHSSLESIHVPHIQGTDRHAVIQLPPILDDYLAPDTPVRVIDAFDLGAPDLLDRHRLGFTRAVAPRMGRPADHPADLLTRYGYGYLNRVRSSRLLEREAQRTVERMWLLTQRTPDVTTIADVRNDTLQPIRAVCRAFTLVCNVSNGCISTKNNGLRRALSAFW